ncbi:MAG TPA: diacylglycerol kinase family protein [Candidatus Limnocylindria bacterium]|jgi:diacylglycerol kinase family enzyme
MTGTAIFLNRGAGTARTGRVAEMVELARRALDADVHVAETRDPVEMEDWLGGLVTGYDTAVIVGGDGSLGIGLNVAARHKELTLGFLPAGFGNAAKHLLRLPADPGEIVDVLRRGDAREVDLITVGERLALFAGVGWDATVAGRYADGGAHGLIGWASAIAQSVPGLWHRARVEVIADGWTVHRGPMTMLVVSTTPFYGRGLRVNPGARPDAGRLSLRSYAGPAPQLALEAGRWVANVTPRARRVDARVIEVRALDDEPIPVQADGDLVGQATAWRFELRPAAVRLIGRWG